MPEPSEWTSNLREQFTSSLKQSQELMQQGLEAWFDLATTSWSAPKAGLSFKPKLPERADLEANFQLVQEMLAAQKEFATWLVDEMLAMQKEFATKLVETITRFGPPSDAPEPAPKAATTKPTTATKAPTS